MEKTALIMAGGRGTRLWPLSRKGRPKQFLALGEDKPLISATVKRLNGLVGSGAIFVVADKGLLELAKPLLPGTPDDNFVAEPGPRDSAPGALLGTLAVAEAYGNDALVAMLPADHIIKDPGLFRDALEVAYEQASEAGIIVTFGIQPNRPETGYGYIEETEEIVSADVSVSRVKRFVEKPDYETARSYLEDGGYYWNSGMFVWRADTMLDAWRKIRPEENDTIDKLRVAYRDNDRKTLTEAFNLLEKVSLDYAIMEEYDDIRLVKGSFPWDDLGSFEALERTNIADESGNIVDGDVHCIDSGSNIVLGRGGRPVFLLETEGLIVIDSGDALLIYPKGKGQAVKDAVEYVRKNYEELL
ncbi:MAG: mannose-1-phosphate guanylyltransferase [bacterium]|nr:mannose-1-phosphate guanylyltransferase [bacterium]